MPDASMTDSGHDEDSDALLRARKAEEEGDLSSAEEAYRQLVDADCPDSEAAYRLAHILSDRGDYGEAALFFEKAIEQGDLEYAPMDLATVLADELDRKGDAERLIKEALARGQRRGLVNLGVLRTKEGRFKEAEEALNQALSAHIPYAHLHMGKLLEAKGQIDEAVAEYLRCVDDELDGDAWKHPGWHLLELGRLDAAEAMFRRGVEAGDGKNYRYLGRVLHEMNRSEEAKRTFEEALANDQRDVLVEYGIMLRDTGRTEDAEQTLYEALQEGDSDAHLELAHLYRVANRADDAEREYQAAILAGDDDAFRPYGALLMERGELAKAQLQLERAVERGDEKAADDLRDLRKRLGAKTQ